MNTKTRNSGMKIMEYQRSILIFILALILFPGIPTMNAQPNKGGNSFQPIQKEVIVPASISDVWNAWTTTEGVTTFFAPKAKVELKIGGAYEMYFNPSAPQGSQGGEGLTILSYEPESMLSFTWSAPPQFPNVRKERTWVIVRFNEHGNKKTKVTLTHLGWKRGEEWNKVYDYFDKAWELVLARLQYRFAAAPIDWNNPIKPQLQKKSDENKLQFIVRLQPVNNNTVDIQEREQHLVEHYTYMQNLFDEGLLIFAGRSTEDSSCVIVIETQSQEETRHIVENDPAVKAKIFLPELHPFQVALRAK